MASSSKLRNIEAINKMLRGEHRTQTRKVFGYTNIDKARESSIIRNVGDVWEEIDANGNVHIWEQHDGWRVRKSPNSDVFQEIRDELNTFKNCPKDKCTCYKPTRLDKKFRVTHGMCFECVTAEETKMQIAGGFDAYAKRKMFENVKAFFRDRDAELEAMKKSVSDGYQFVNEGGDIETWGYENPKAEIDKLEAAYLEYKQKVLDMYDPDKQVVESEVS